VMYRGLFSRSRGRVARRLTENITSPEKQKIQIIEYNFATSGIKRLENVSHQRRTLTIIRLYIKDTDSFLIKKQKLNIIVSNREISINGRRSASAQLAEPRVEPNEPFSYWADALSTNLTRSRLYNE
jgi:hypothetical protein